MMCGFGTYPEDIFSESFIHVQKINKAAKLIKKTEDTIDFS